MEKKKPRNLLERQEKIRQEEGEEREIKAKQSSQEHIL